MPHHLVTSKTFAQASTPSNRIVFTFSADSTVTTGTIVDSDLQFTFGPNNASSVLTPNRVQIIPTLIEKVIVSNGALVFYHNMPGSFNSGSQYTFVSGHPYDFSESGGLPIRIGVSPTGFNYDLTVGTASFGATAQIVLRGYQAAPRN